MQKLQELLENQKKLENQVQQLQKKVQHLEEWAGIEEEPVKKEKVKKQHVENLGFKLFGGIGFFLILIGLFTFYRYAVQQGWIGPIARIAAGVIFSVAILLLAELFRKKQYERFSQLLFGGGVGLLYFTMYATYHFPLYREALGMNLLVNTLLLLAVTGFGVYLAIRKDSKLLTIFSFLLGYAAALLAGGSHQLLILTAILSGGMTVILLHKKWHFATLPVICAYAIFGFFLANNSTLPEVSMLYLLGFFALFTVLGISLHKEKHIESLVVASATAFFTPLYGLGIVDEHWEAFTGLFVLLLAGIYFVLGYVMKKQEQLGLTYTILSAIGLVLFIPVQFEQEWITIFWAVSGALFTYLGKKLSLRSIRVVGYIALGLAAFSALILNNFMLEAGSRAAGMLVTVLCLYAAAVITKDVSEEKYMHVILGLFGTAVLTVGFGVEILDPDGIFTALAEDTRQVVLTIVWAVQAIVLILYGFMAKSNAQKIAGTVIFGLALVKLLFIDLQDLSSLNRIIVSMIVGVLALTASFLYVRNKEKIEKLLSK